MQPHPKKRKRSHSSSFLDLWDKATREQRETIEIRLATHAVQEDFLHRWIQHEKERKVLQTEGQRLASTSKEMMDAFKEFKFCFQ